MSFKLHIRNYSKRVIYIVGFLVCCSELYFTIFWQGAVFLPAWGVRVACYKGSTMYVSTLVYLLFLWFKCTKNKCGWRIAWICSHLLVRKFLIFLFYAFLHRVQNLVNLFTVFCHAGHCFYISLPLFLLHVKQPSLLSLARKRSISIWY